jgi:phage shock protein A
MSVDVDPLVSRAAEPHAAFEQCVDEMERSITELRRQVVANVAHRRELEEQLAQAARAAENVERKAAAALKSGDERLARSFVSSGIRMLKSRDSLREKLAVAKRSQTERLVRLIQIEDRARRACSPRTATILAAPRREQRAGVRADER